MALHGRIRQRTKCLKGALIDSVLCVSGHITSQQAPEEAADHLALVNLMVDEQHLQKVQL